MLEGGRGVRGKVGGRGGEGRGEGVLGNVGGRARFSFSPQRGDVGDFNILIGG